eukprot:2982336-Rhodomonas_salina.1
MTLRSRDRLSLFAAQTLAQWQPACCQWQLELELVVKGASGKQDGQGTGISSWGVRVRLGGA